MVSYSYMAQPDPFQVVTIAVRRFNLAAAMFLEGVKQAFFCEWIAIMFSSKHS